MKFISATIAFFVCLNLHAQNELNGFYIGTKEVAFKDLGGWERATIQDQDPRRKFYNVSHLKIFNDSVFLDQFSISVFQGITTILPNDGIYHFFDGNVLRTDSTVLFKLKEVVVNYFEQMITVGENGLLTVICRRYNLQGKINEKDIIIDGVVFKPKFQYGDMISENPEIFTDKKNKKLRTRIEPLPLDWKK